MWIASLNFVKISLVIKFISKSERQTKRLAEALASHLKGGEILALSGALGSGKTTFVKGLARGFGLRTRVVSPTFVIIRPHEIPAYRGKTFYHVDLYRLKSAGDLWELGFSEILQNQKNIVVIEWPEMARRFLPKRTIKIKFFHTQNPRERIISFSNL